MPSIGRVDTIRGYLRAGHTPSAKECKTLYRKLILTIRLSVVLLLLATVRASAQGVHPQYSSGNCNQQDLAFAIATAVQEGVEEVTYIGESKTGQLSVSDDMLDDGTYYDIWVLYVCRTTNVVIDMISSNMDSYLLLSQWPTRNPDVVRQVADDDDAGGGTDARITRRLTPGVYGVVPSTYSRATGSYRISIRER